MSTKTWFIAGGIVVGVVLIWVVLRGLSSRTAVQAVQVTTGPIKEFVDEQAVTRLPETYLITMPFPGRIESITLSEGAPVKKGDVVARIIPFDLDLTVKQATAAVQRLEAAIRKNADNQVEETGFKQAIQYVESMNATVQAALARVEASQTRYDYAEKNLGRIQGLVSGKAATEDELDRAVQQKDETMWNLRQDQWVHAAMQSLKAATNLMPTMIRQYIGRKDLEEAVLEKQKAEAEARLQEILEQQRRGTMTSPLDGVVLARHITNERFLPAGTTLLEIGRLEDLQVEADILSLDVVDAGVGDAVEIYGPAIGRRPARGTVRRIYPAGFTKISSLGVEQQRVKVVIDFHQEDLQRLLTRQNLGVGYRVRVKIFTADKSDARVIPRSALFRGSHGQWQVYAIRDKRARIQNVEIGMINDEAAEVTAGLEPDDLVVRSPESNLADGQPVKLTTQEPQENDE